jgi:chromosomal replication initiation ATPase DnaA
MGQTEYYICKRCACKIAVKPLLKMQDITFKAATYFGISLFNILGHCREERFVKPRFFAIYFMLENNYCVTEIGRFFNGRNHASIVHVRKKMKNTLAIYDKDKADYEAFKITFL